MVSKEVDDILIWAPDMATLQSRIEEISSRCKILNIVLSKKKFVIGSTLPFAGYIVSSQGVQPNQDRVAAIRNFPSPKDQTGIKYFLGLANQLIFIIPDFAHNTKLMRDLLGQGKVFRWLPEHEEEFAKMKSILSDKLLTRHFVPSLPCLLYTSPSPRDS